MDKLLKVFVDICLMRAGPQQLPASTFLLALTLVVHAALGLVLALFTLPLPQALTAALLGTTVLLAMVRGLLLLHRKPQRLRQTATALAGSEVVFGLVALPLTVWFYAVEEDSQRLLPSLLWMVVVVWGVVVVRHIFAHALGVRPGVALLFALAYTIIGYIAVDLVVGFPS